MIRGIVREPKAAFLVVWFGQLVSAMGTGLSGFALGVWVYQKTGSTTEFALIAVSTRIPGILFAPFGGALADRWDRRRVMLIANAVSGLAIVSPALLLHMHDLQVWHIYLAVGVIATAGAFRDPAYYASVSQMVPRNQLGRASGLVISGENIGMVAPPVVAGVLVIAIGISGVLVIDLFTYVVGFLTASAAVFPARVASQHQDEAEKPSLWRDTVAGWKYVMANRGIFYLAVNGAATSFSIGMTQIVITPMVLDFASARVLGVIFSVGGLAMLVGGLVMSAWGGPAKKVRGVLWFGIAQSVGLVVVAFRQNAVSISVGIFVILFSIQIVRGCSDAAIRAHVPDDKQARVFAMSRFIAWSTLPLSYLAAGPLASGVFEPLLRPSGSLAGSVGSVIGTGKGRGIALMLVVLAVLYLLSVLISYSNPRMRNVEKELGVARPEGDSEGDREGDGDGGREEPELNTTTSVAEAAAGDVGLTT